MVWWWWSFPGNTMDTYSQSCEFGPLASLCAVFLLTQHCSINFSYSNFVNVKNISPPPPPPLVGSKRWAVIPSSGRCSRDCVSFRVTQCDHLILHPIVRPWQNGKLNWDYMDPVMGLRVSRVWKINTFLTSTLQYALLLLFYPMKSETFLTLVAVGRPITQAFSYVYHTILAL
jgi:hypothetical protein